MWKLLLLLFGLIIILCFIRNLIDPVKITDSDRARSMAKEFVSQKLISPSTADFSPIDQTTVIPQSTGYKVKGWVDSKNVFNAIVRNNYEVTLHKQGEYWICDEMLINGLKVE